ncbi:MAG TPA: hypothetical protein GX513_09145 [Firmicutes bacterium]|nr:hypothetical protein [Bacillota bacterium]
MERRHVTFGSPDSASWLRPEAIEEVVWREDVPYRVLDIYFGGETHQITRTAGCTSGG